MSNSVCRVCLKDDSTLYDLFELVVVDDEENQIPLHEMLSFCCNFTVVDSPPQSICANCIDDCNKAYNFIKLFQKNNIIFTKLYHDKIKDESSNLDNQNSVKIEIIDESAANNDSAQIEPLSVENLIEKSVELPVKLKIDQTVVKSNIRKRLNDSKTRNKPGIVRNSDPSKNHECPVCDQKFIRYSYYVNHIKTHSGEFSCHLCTAKHENWSEFKEHYFRDHYNSCSICAISFVSRKELHYHNATRHKELVKRRVFKTNRSKSIQKIDSELPVHVCPICQSEQQYSTRFAKHMSENHGDEPVDCNKCADSFANAKDFLFHYIRRHYNYCDICEIGFDERDSFNKHQRMHLERECFALAKAFNCPVCNESCDNFDCFISHLTENHFSGSVVCNVCSEIVSSPNEFVVHYETEHRIKCDKCEAYLATQKQFQAHINKKFVKKDSVEPKLEDKSLTESIKRLKSGYNRHICPICESEFRYLAEYRLHILNMHLEYDNKTPVTCNYCDKACLNLSDFFTHYQNEHYIQCITCKKFFTHKLLLKQHKCRPKIKHKHVTQSVTKVCMTCGKSYVGNLKKHEEMHDSKFNYKCEICNMKFIGYDQMRYHRLKKHNLMKYLCSHCGQRFVNKTQFATHTSAHFGIKPFKCEICKQNFVKKSSYVKHVERKLCGKTRRKDKLQEDMDLDG